MISSCVDFSKFSNTKQLFFEQEEEEEFGDMTVDTNVTEIEVASARMSLESTNSCMNKQETFTFGKSSTFEAHQDIKVFLESVKDKFNSFKITQKNKNDIYDTCVDLVKNSFIFANKLIQDQNGMDTVLALNRSSEYICSQLIKDSTQFKRNRNCEANDKYVAPISKGIGTRWIMDGSSHSPSRHPRRIQNKMQYIPITDTVKSLFLREDFRKAYFEHNFEMSANPHKCKTGVYQNFCCGEMFKKNDLFSMQPESIQIQIGADDCTVASPLQPNAIQYKFTLVYFTIRNISTKYLSKLDNIYLACVCFTDDLKSEETDFNDIWRLVVRDMHNLETFGVQVFDEVNIKGTLISLCFDNLGAHTALGFAESSNTSNYCIFCEMPKDVCQKATRLVPEYTRTLANYSKQLDIIANSSEVNYSETKGIKRYCALNELQYFHMFENQGLDIMHDVAEGAILFTLKSLFEFCFSHKIFKEKILREKVQYFHYGASANTPSTLIVTKDNLNQKACQSKCLFENIPFILWDYKENTKFKEVWICVESLLKICQIIYSSEITEEDLKDLEHEVDVHLSSYQKVFKRTLRPKQHNLLHYADLIRKMGPLVNMNMIRYEGKHQEIKNHIYRTKNYKDIPKYLAVTHQQQLLTKKNTYEEDISHGIPTPVKEISGQGRSCILNYFHTNDEVKEVKWLQYFGTRFNKGLKILHNSHIYEISNIFYAEKKFYFLCIKNNFIQFHSFSNSLKIETSHPFEYTIISFVELNLKKTFESKIVDNESYISANILDFKKVV